MCTTFAPTFSVFLSRFAPTRTSILQYFSLSHVLILHSCVKSSSTLQYFSLSHVLILHSYFKCSSILRYFCQSHVLIQKVKFLYITYIKYHSNMNIKNRPLSKFLSNTLYMHSDIQCDCEVYDIPTTCIATFSVTAKFTTYPLHA